MTHLARPFLLCLALAACRKPCPAPKTPETVYSTLSAPTCNLPSLPDTVLVNVGFPTPDDILVSRTDYAMLLAFVDELRDWIAAASACLEAGRR